jgi:hypothetical protein
MRLSLTITSAAVLLVGSAATASAASRPAGNDVYAVSAVTAPLTASLALVQDPQPPAKGEVNVKVDADGGNGAWYGNPLWIVLGVVALVLVVLLVALAGRGGSDTTIVS